MKKLNHLLNRIHIRNFDCIRVLSRKSTSVDWNETIHSKNLQFKKPNLELPVTIRFILMKIMSFIEQNSHRKWLLLPRWIKIKILDEKKTCNIFQFDQNKRHEQPARHLQSLPFTLFVIISLKQKKKMVAEKYSGFLVSNELREIWSNSFLTDEYYEKAIQKRIFYFSHTYIKKKTGWKETKE